MDRLLMIFLVNFVSWFYWPCSGQNVQAESDLSSVNQCTKTNQILTPLDMFYLSARYYSYCTEKFGNKTLINGTSEYSCEQGPCQSCLKTCKTITAKTTSDCLSKCTGNHSVACQDGCNFYVGITNQALQGNYTGSYPPSSAVNYPLVPSIGYKQMKLEWNTTVSSSPVFYIIYAAPVSQGSTGLGPYVKRRKRMVTMNLKPINITIHAQKTITRSLICKKFPNHNHKSGTKFVYEIVGVAKSGWVSATQPSNPAIQVTFTPADRVANLTAIGEPFLTKSVTLEYVINYKVQWQQKPGAHVSHYMARYEETQCRYHGVVSPLTISSGSNNATIQIHPPVLDTTPCDITLIITSMLDCLVGQSTRLTVSYKGCQIFPNAPSQCNKSLTTTIPATVPPVIAWKSSEQFICQSYVDSICHDGVKSAACKNCTRGYYNATMIWNKPNVVGNVQYYKCKLYIFHEKFNQFLPLGPDWDEYQTRTILTNLQPNKAYQFKVFVFTSTNAGEHPTWFSVQGFNFNTKAIPAPTFAPPHTTLIPRTPLKFTTTKAESTKQATTAKQRVKEHDTNNNQTIGLAAGLGTALFVVLVGGILFILFERRRRRRKDNKKNFTTTEFSCAHYQPTPPIDDWEIPIQNIVFGEAIGEGAFGKVYTATVKGVTLNYSPTRSASANSLSEVTLKSDSSRRSEITMKAAVKILQDGPGEQQRVEFLEEIKLMKEVGQHKNIVSLLACVTQSFPLCLVVEFMPFGDLLHYLRGRRSKILSHPPMYVNDQFYALKYISDAEINNTSRENLMPYINSDDQNDARKNKTSENRLKVPNEIKSDNTSNKINQNDDDDDITPEDLLRFSWQIASGMEFLAKKGFVHRDLAARNVLVGPNKSCKISDFGLTRFVYEEKVYMGKRSRRLPIKWMSIEAIVDQVFTTYSDVWSFGVLLFEIVTLGGTPYPTLTSQAMLRLLRTGYRMEKPDTCSDELYNVMMACWLENPTSRPTFTDIKERLEQLISEGTPYLEFDFDDSKPYYNVPSFRSIEDSEEDDSDDDEDEIDDTTLRFTSLDRRANGIENGCHVDVASKGKNEGKLNVPLDKEKEERYAWSTKLAKAHVDA